MKLLRLSGAFSIAVLSFVPCFHTHANVLEPDYPCFMITQSGQAVDLSESLCGFKKSAPEISANSGQAFSEDKKRNLLEQEALQQQEALRQQALRQIQSSKDNVPTVTDAYIPR